MVCWVGFFFCALNLRVDSFFLLLFSNQEGFDAVIKNTELMGVPRDVNSPGKSGVERERKRERENLGDQSFFLSIVIRGVVLQEY